MKIGAFTILTIIIFIFTTFGAYMGKSTFDMQNDLCQSRRPNENKPIETFSYEMWDSLQQCYTDRGVYSVEYNLRSGMAFIFFWLVLLSWRIDSLEKR